MKSTAPANIYATIGVALLGAGLVAGTPMDTPRADTHLFDLQLTAGAESITLDLVRHGDNLTGPPATTPAGTGMVAQADGGQGSEGVSGGPPGAPLSALGQQQAQTVSQQIQAQYGDNIAGIYGGTEPRMWQTVQPLADALGMDVHQLAGLNEIDGGVYAGDPLSSTGGIEFMMTLAAWALGLEFVPMPGSPDINGVQFEDIFNSATQTIYDNTVSADGPTTAIAASGEAAITAWALMNANNPDISVFIPMFIDELEGKTTLLPNVGQVVLQGGPGDWTLVSFNGTPVPPADLLTSLFVDLRNVIVAPQAATWHIWEALSGGDPTAIQDALQTGLKDVGAALLQFPQSVITDVIDALGGGGSASAGDALGDSLTSLF